MVEILVTTDGRTAPSLIVRKHLDDHVHLEHQVRWLTRAQGSGVVRLYEVGSEAGHYSSHFGGPLTLAAAATAPGATLAILADVWDTLERLHRVGLVHGAIAPDHVVLGREGPLLLSPGCREAVDRRTDIASFGRMVTGLAEVWSTDAAADTPIIEHWKAVGRQVAALGDTAGLSGGDRLISGAEVRRLLAELGPTRRRDHRFAARRLRKRRGYGSGRGRRAGRRPSRS